MNDVAASTPSETFLINDPSRIEPTPDRAHNFFWGFGATRPAVPVELLRALILYQLGIARQSQEPKHIFYANVLNISLFIEKEMKMILQIPTNVKNALKVIQSDAPLNDLKKAENPFTNGEGDCKEKVSQKLIIFEKIKNEKNNGLGDIDGTKKLSEDKTLIIEEQLFEKQILNKYDKKIKREELPTSLNETSINNESLLHQDKRNLSKKEGIYRESEEKLSEEGSSKSIRTNSIGTNSIGTNSIGTQQEARDSSIRPLRIKEQILEEKAAKKEIKELVSQPMTQNSPNCGQLEHVFKLLSALVRQENSTWSQNQFSGLKGEALLQTEGSKSFVANPGFVVIPYVVQEKVKTLSSKNEKFKFKKVVRKKKSPDHEKEDEELNYPTIDDIS